jgi:hypothetical protein
MQSDPDDDVRFPGVSLFDKILITIILIVSITSIYWISRRGHQISSESKIAVVYQDSKLSQEVGLEQDRLTTLPLEEMQIQVKAGMIRVARSDCPKQICVNMGWIKTPGQIIVCAPNKMLVEIKSSDPQFLDAVVY